MLGKYRDGGSRNNINKCICMNKHRELTLPGNSVCNPLGFFCLAVGLNYTGNMVPEHLKLKSFPVLMLAATGVAYIIYNSGVK